MSDIYVLNGKNFLTEGDFDTYKSLIWTDRYSAYGDFEIYTSATTEMLNLLQKNRILWREDSEHQMIIEQIKVESDVELGVYLTITGRSLESILKRRIIWDPIILNGNLQNNVELLINNSIIKPSIVSRKIDNFIFKRSYDPEITKLSFNGEFKDCELYDAIKEICDSVSIGFKITLNENNQFIFELYCGKDRCYSQEKLPQIVFSPSFDNIINANYVNSNMIYKNVGLVVGEIQIENEENEENEEDEEYEKYRTERRTVIVGNNNLTGLERREVYIDGRDISSKDDEGENISEDEYRKLLIQRGNEKLKENKITHVYDGEVDTTSMFVYQRDFFLGDIVQLENAYNMSFRSRIIEFIYSDDVDGICNYPSFEVLDNEE